MIDSRSSVVAVSPVDDDNIVCIIQDLVDSNGGAVSKQSLNLQASVPARQAACDIARACGYKEHSISVHYEMQLGGGGDVLLEDQDIDVSLGTVCNTGAKRHKFTIHELDGTMPQKLDDVTLPSSERESANERECSISRSLSCNMSSLKSETGYLGLVNQAMTCYLNSLLQTLFMTPEFRNALYRWTFDGSDEEKVKSIPYQLQRLFLQLQTSKKKAVETTDLTRSFGWDSSEVWQQHDVQELCRVMFDALEQKWKNTGQANLINQLYQGKMKDYVKCLECGYESARIDAYLDIPLVIRPFGSSETYGSVKEAMKAFVQPEILDGTDQYFCERCNKKCNAHKGLKFVTFPYLLTLQLKRFDFDYATMHRIKLNDKMSFPEVLDLNIFITPSDQTLDDLDQLQEEKAPGMSNGQVDSSDDGIDEGIEIENGCSVGSSSSDSSSISSDAAANNSRNSCYSGEKGPYVYELFSIMIHSGSAAGGHYYAYVKSFKDGLWYSFNDQQVSKITYDDIRKTYGGSTFSRGFYSSAYTSSTSAYMLMYRQIDKKMNADFMQMEDFPESLKTEFHQQKEKEEAERRQREIDKSTCKIKLYCFHPSHQHKMDVKLEIHKDKTLQETTEMARELFHLQSVVPLDCCRLVKYDEYQDSLEKSFEGEESTSICVLLGGVKSSYTFDLLLETKRSNQTFQEYKPGGVTVKVYLVDIYQSLIQLPVSVRTYHVQTVAEFKQQLQQVLGLPSAEMRCVLEKFPNDLRLLAEPHKSLKAEGFYKSNKVFVEASGDEMDNSVPYAQSRLCGLLDQYQHTIRVTCCLPSQRAVQEYITSLKEMQARASYKAAQSSPPATLIVPPTHSDAGVPELSHVDEGISENDSAFYSGGTNSKHSLAGVEHGSSYSINSAAVSCEPGLPTNTSHTHDGLAAAFEEDLHIGLDKSDVPKWIGDYDESLSSSGMGEHSARVRDYTSCSSRPHSSSHEHLAVDMANLCSKLSSSGLTSSRSDPSIYHTCVDHSDDSLQCLGSGPSTGSQDDTSTSAEFNFGCSGPDPEPILSSPEDGYGFEDDNEEEKESDVTAVSPRVSSGNGRRSGIVIHNLHLGPINSQFHTMNYSAQFPVGQFEPSEDWDRELNSYAPQCDHPFPSSSSTLPHSTWSFPPGEADTPSHSHSSAETPAHEHEDSADICLRQAKHRQPPPPPPPPLPHSFPERGSNRTDSALASSKQTNNDEEEPEIKWYFHAVMSEPSEPEERILNVSVDKRITLGAFKCHLEPYVGVASNLFKVYRVYSNNQEFESVRLSDTLSFFEDGKFNIKLGRALLSGEHRVKVFQLSVNEPEPCKFLIETIFAKGMTVLESKQLILEELKDQKGLDISLDRCRLRKKSWTNPGTVYLDTNVYENEIPIYPNWEIFLELMDGPEELRDSSHLAIYVRWWHPSTHQMDPFREVVLQHQSVEELKLKISALSGIPVEDVEFAKGKGTFPCEVSVLEIHTCLEWDPNVSTLNMWPLYICDDGHVIYFRDVHEELVELSDDRKKEIQQKENRISRQSHRITCSPRKERALKIYTDEDKHSPTSKTSLELD